jgi:hypothetical protein
MKLAEALTARADLQRRIEQLRARITANARFQEGEEPSEDASSLLVDAESDLARLRDLIRRINATNARLDLGADGTMTDALATRDVLRLRHSLLADAAASASGNTQFPRQMRSELRQPNPAGELDQRSGGVAEVGSHDEAGTTPAGRGRSRLLWAEGSPDLASRSPARRTGDRAPRISHHRVPIVVTRVGQGTFRFSPRRSPRCRRHASDGMSVALRTV